MSDYKLADLTNGMSRKYRRRLVNSAEKDLNGPTR